MGDSGMGCCLFPASPQGYGARVKEEEDGQRTLKGERLDTALKTEKQ